MPAKNVHDQANPPCSMSLQGAWPMVENAVRQPRAPHRPSLECDEEAERTARSVEARTKLPRAAGGVPSLDRDTARALVDAGYMPVADYIALYEADVAADRALPAAEPEQTVRVTGHFPAAFPRRHSYRVTSVRCTFSKPLPRRARRA